MRRNMKGVPKPRGTIRERLWAKVDTSGDCWFWTARCDPNGYGRFRIADRMVAAHRATYEDVIGPIPEGLVLDHLCRTPTCVRPDHLEPVTQGENVLRGETLYADQVTRTHCPAGHTYDETNTYWEGTKRHCRNCRRENNRAWAARQRAKARNG